MANSRQTEIEAYGSLVSSWIGDFLDASTGIDISVGQSRKPAFVQAAHDPHEMGR